MNETGNVKARHWTIGKAAELLEKQGYRIPINTLRHWFNELERHRIHTLLKSPNRNERLLTETDLEIAKFIFEQKETYGSQVNLKSLGPFIIDKFPDYVYFDTSTESGNIESGAIVHQLDEEKLKGFIAGIIQEQVREQVSIIEQRLEKEHKERLALLPSPEEEETRLRAIMTTVKITENRKRRELEREAEELWKRNPITTGFLFKKEDIARKAEFIKAYVDERIDDALKS